VLLPLERRVGRPQEVQLMGTRGARQHSIGKGSVHLRVFTQSGPITRTAFLGLQGYVVQQCYERRVCPAL
jgi:hypothetical protein